MRLIGVDVGGTFTDLVFADTEAGRTEVHKVSTTPDDPSRGVVAGVALFVAYPVGRFFARFERRCRKGNSTLRSG